MPGGVAGAQPIMAAPYANSGAGDSLVTVWAPAHRQARPMAGNTREKNQPEG